jgi:DNA-binding NarL/FixJ family response regulator
MRKIRVLLVDDHQLLRAGLRFLINGQLDMEVVGEAADSQEALIKARASQPDLAILQPTIPRNGSLSLIERLAQERPQIKVLVVTTHGDRVSIQTALTAGAWGYATINAADAEILNAVRSVFKGHIFVNAQGSNRSDTDGLGRGPRRGAVRKTGADALSQRERQVLALLARGHTNQETAEQLFLSVKTVETYRARIAQKLGIRSRADLVRYAIEMNLFSPPEYDHATNAE